MSALSRLEQLDQLVDGLLADRWSAAALSYALTLSTIEHAVTNRAPLGQPLASMLARAADLAKGLSLPGPMEYLRSRGVDVSEIGGSTH